MSFTDYPMKSGKWDLTLKPETPRAILREIDVRRRAFDHLVVLPAHLDHKTVSDATMLARSRYVGIFRGQSASGLVLKGAGLPVTLGDEDGKGDIFESERSTVNGWLSQWFTGLLPTGLYRGQLLQNPGGSYTGKFKFINFREAWDILCDAYNVEWRVNNDFTFDVGTVDGLYGTQPKVMIVGPSAGVSPGRDLAGTVVQSIPNRETDFELYTTKVIYQTGEQEKPTTTIQAINGTGDSDRFRRPDGNPLVMDRVIEAYNDKSTNPAVLAAAHLGRFTRERLAWSVDAGDYDIGRDMKVGQPLWIYDPLSELIDLSAPPVTIRGVQTYPVRTRLMGLKTAFTQGMGIYIRTPLGGGNASYTDITPYVRWESPSQSIEIGSLPRSSAP